MGDLIRFPSEVVQQSERLRQVSEIDRRAIDQRREMLRTRNRAIVTAVQGGYPQCRAAVDCDLSPSTIMRIVDAATPPAAA